MPGGRYTARQNADFTWDIGPAPFLPAHPVIKQKADGTEETFMVDANWLRKAVAINQYRARNGPYFSPVHIGHHLTPDGRWVDREYAGRLTYNAVKNFKYQGIVLPTMFGFLRWVPEAVYARIRSGELAYLSGEVYDFSTFEVQGVALMADATPHFRLPMFTIGREIPHPDAATRTAPAGVYRAVARRGKAVVYAAYNLEAKKMPQGEAGSKRGMLAKTLQAAADIDDEDLLTEENPEDVAEPPVDLPELEPVDINDDEIAALLDMPDELEDEPEDENEGEMAAAHPVNDDPEMNADEPEGEDGVGKGEEGTDTGGSAKGHIQRALDKGFSQEEIGNAVGRDAATISSIMSGDIENPPSDLISKLKKVADRPAKDKPEGGEMDMALQLAHEKGLRRNAEAKLRTSRKANKVDDLAQQITKFATGMASYGYVPEEVNADCQAALKAGGKPALAAYIKGVRKGVNYQLSGGKKEVVPPPEDFIDEGSPPPKQDAKNLTFLRAYSPGIQAAGAKMYQEAVVLNKSGYSCDPERHVMKALEESGSIKFTDDQKQKYNQAG